MDRVICHVDMDEFFAAVEKLDNPALRGKPLLIGGSPHRRGVVSTASYEARPFGCHSAMPMATAVRLCPQAIVLGVRGRRYRAISERVFEIFHRFTPAVEPLSIDEAFLDVTGSERLFGSGERIARAIKEAIAGKIGLTASVGVAPNKFLAKLASDLEKPDGLTVITAETREAKLAPLPVGRLWGVGPAAAAKLASLGLRTIGQIAQADGDWLEQALGEFGRHVHRLANGVDDRPVVTDHQAKSIGQEETFAHDVGDLEQLRQTLRGQVEQVARRLRKARRRARTVTVKLRTGDFTTATRCQTLDEATDVTDELFALAAELLGQWARRGFRPLRLLGMSVSQLTARPGRQLSLFDSQQFRRQRGLDEALDRIAGRFGPGAVHRGLERADDADRANSFKDRGGS